MTKMLARSLSLHAPAKLNLYLAILGKRADGYHNLYTLFQRISLFDEIRIVPADGKSPLLKVSGFPVPSDESNLIVRAYRLLRSASSKTPLVSITLKKNIPVAAGLGGGSSDAGTFLDGMNRGFHLGLSCKKIGQLAAELGADVPFFAMNRSCALGSGRGDLLRPISFSTRFWFAIASFPKGLSTKEIYCLYDSRKCRSSSLTKAKHDVSILSNYLRQKDLSQIQCLLKNDLLPICLHMKPAIKRVLNFMKQNGSQAISMSGSGPTCFAILENRYAAEKLAKAISCTFHLRVDIAHSF